MKIVAVTLLDHEFNQVFHNNFESKINSQHMIVISSFVNGLNNFGSSEFQGQLRRIDFSNLWFDFLQLENYYAILVIKVDQGTIHEDIFKANKMIEDIRNYIRKITIESETFSFENNYDVEMFSSLLGMYLSMFRDKRLEVVISDNDISQEINYNVDMAYICEPSGVPIIYRKYSTSRSDPVLISSMLSSITHFSNIEFNKKIRRILIGNTVLYFKHGENLLYIMVMSYDRDHYKVITQHIEYRIIRILDTLSETIDLLFDDGGVDQNQLNEIVDEYIRESIDN
ncbi:MAG: hypothetical protein INQ03_17540 [Candidatus Heimdallarchaeota archaeon]|nr:hypothetical protein [Candidatus Heimdallarchaeota archaeon]